jgi:PmbA protein
LTRSSEDLAGALIDAARQAGADAADALVTHGEELGIGTRGGTLEEVERSEGTDLGLRVFVGQRQACVSSSDTRPAAIAEMAVRAVAMAREAPEDPWCGLSALGERGTPVDHATLGLDDGAGSPEPAALEGLARSLEAAAMAVDGVAQVDRASAGWQRGSVTLATSDGFLGGYSRTTHSLVASAIAGQGTGMESDYDYATRRDAASLPSPEEIGRRAGERAIARLGARKAPAGPVPVVFDRRVASSLIGHLLSAINGMAVARGASWLKDAMDTAVLPDWADLVEEPLRAGGGATRPFDGEGIAASPSKPIVTSGVLRRWLLDCATARQLGLATTGNARRGTGSPPSPGAGNIRLAGGQGDLEGLLSAMGTGLLVTSLIGSSVNPTTGAYSRGASGFWVENGALAYPVSEVTIAGSLPEMMRGLTAADDGDPHMNAVVPSLLVDGLVVA